MPAKKFTAADIVGKWKGVGPCDIVCRLCSNAIVADPPATVWNGHVGLGQKTSIDEHEQCDVIENAIQPQLATFLSEVGIKPEDHQRARDVLRQLLDRY